jgi:23S rRNA (adenine2503-C2)-methyltransferase
VLLPRDGVCVSSQVGCAVGCQFCMTGQGGLVRQVTSGEIVAQVVLARRQRPVKKVVFMGMGEPAHNLDNVMEAIELLGVEGNIAHKNLVFSTVGDPRVFERLPQGPVKPALALSLHTTKPALRERLLPRAPRITPAQLVEEGERYARLTGYPIQYQWTLMEGVNDGQDELDAIVGLLRGKYAVLNMIPYNANEGLPFRRPGWDKAHAIAAWLFERGILTKLRDSAGQDVDGGCGQLRARAGWRPADHTAPPRVRYAWARCAHPTQSPPVPTPDYAVRPTGSIRCPSWRAFTRLRPACLASYISWSASAIMPCGVTAWLPPKSAPTTPKLAVVPSGCRLRARRAGRRRRRARARPVRARRPGGSPAG